MNDLIVVLILGLVGVLAIVFIVDLARHLPPLPRYRSICDEYAAGKEEEDGD